MRGETADKSRADKHNHQPGQCDIREDVVGSGRNAVKITIERVPRYENS